VVFSGTFDGKALKGVISVVGLEIDFTGAKPSAQSTAADQSKAEQGEAR
jgi:hypothetical protein